MSVDPEAELRRILADPPSWLRWPVWVIGWDIIQELDERFRVPALARLAWLMSERDREALFVRARGWPSEESGLELPAHVWRFIVQEFLASAQRQRTMPAPPPMRGIEPPPEEPRMPWDPPPVAANGAHIPVRDRVVNTGLATLDAPLRPIDERQSLSPARAYYFWFEFAQSRLAGAIDAPSPPLAIKALPARTRLTVVLHGFDDELRFALDADVGQFELDENGHFRVYRQPQQAPPGVSDKRLFFRITTPPTPGNARLRCSIYCRGVLIESRVVTAAVGVATQQPALHAAVDYTLANSFDAAFLDDLDAHALCMLLNDNGNGTHGLRLFGANDANLLKRDVSLRDHELQGWIDATRRAMRIVAWGDEQPWSEGSHYAYGDGRKNLNRLAVDLARFAVEGYRVYRRLIRDLGGDDVGALEQLLRRSVLVQIAARRSAAAYVPTAMIYDIHLDTNAFPTSDYRLCPPIGAALTNGTPIEASVCFQGTCPTRRMSEELRANLDPNRSMRDLGPVVCPSGFWGYRLQLGLPLSVGADDDTPLRITYREAPQLTAGIWTGFQSWPAHEAQLTRGGRKLDVARSRADLVRLLRHSRPHMVYFYCHGGFAGDGSPCLFIGGQDDPGITPDNLDANGIRWDVPRPLVFINGCSTASLEPKLAFDFVSSFVEEVRAAGVIGTEITVFEPLASTFAEAMFEHFLHGVAVAEAVRQARLRVLEQGNPLGLVYVPFVIGSLKMVAA
jgi:hypothetical protein